VIGVVEANPARAPVEPPGVTDVLSSELAFCTWRVIPTYAGLVAGEESALPLESVGANVRPTTFLISGIAALVPT
jgi:hypothetical protein